MNRKEYDRRAYEKAKPAYAALMKFYPLTTDDLDGELWKTIPDYEDYQVSNFGRVKSFKKGKGKIIKPNLNAGYLRVCLSKNDKPKRFSVHRLVAELFVPNPESNPEVNHIDGHKMNNYVGNLEWATREENLKHAYDTGLKIAPQGEEHYKAKFTNEQILYVRANPDGLTQQQLAAKFGVHFKTISKIQRGKIYRNAGGSIRPKFGVPEEIKKQIRSEYVFGSKEFGCRALAKKYGVGQMTVFRIVNP